MQFTDLQNLPCLEGSDYAAVALYMQCLAEQIDTTLTGQSQEFTSMLMRPAAAWVQTGTQIEIPTGGMLTPGPVSYQINWPTVMPAATAPRLANRRGWWYVGASVNLTPAGGSTLNAFFRIRMRVTAGNMSLANLADISDLIYNSNTTNGENLQTATTVFYPGSVSTDSAANPLVTVEVTHSNSSNLNTTLTPPFTVWVAYLGDTPQIGGV
jgi:hypothetical protein